MKYKMVVMDMDDTLLRSDLSISERTKEAIEKAQKKGVKVVLASGRPTFAMKKQAKELKLDEYGSFILSYNGAIITNMKEDKEIFRKTLSKDRVHELIEMSKRHNAFIHTYLDDDIVTENKNEYTEVEAVITGMKIREVECLKSEVNRDVVKVLMLQEPNSLKKIEGNLKNEINDKMSMHISKPFFLEFMEKGIDKAAGVDMLAKNLNIKTEEIIAIGDSYNDLGMIKYAGLGICVANAPDDMKKYADYITDSNMEDGVAKAIEKFILSE